jgi:type II secretory pathway pseudopilin PulG
MIPTSRRGFTLVEVTVVTAIFIGLMYVISTVLDSNAKATRFDVASNDAANVTRRLVRQLCAELVNSGSDDDTDFMTPTRAAGSGTDSDTGELLAVNSITFQVRSGVTGDPATDWGPAITYALQAEEGETAGNDVDDDKDGLTDEQALVRTQGGATVVLARNVLAFEIKRAAGSDAIQVLITTGRAYELAADPDPVTRSADTTVYVRNHPSPTQ